jgi:hypothetical protein
MWDSYANHEESLTDDRDPALVEGDRVIDEGHLLTPEIIFATSHPEGGMV